MMGHAMKQDIIRKATIILGSYGGINSGSSRASKAEELCGEFTEGVIEDTVLSVRWPFALKRVASIEGMGSEFKVIEGVNDCIKLAVIAPSNLEFYIDGGRICFKGARLEFLFYYSKKVINNLIDNDLAIWREVPENFKTLASMNLAAQIAFAMYSDSMFADGLKKQYLHKLEEIRRIYSLDYNLVNSGQV